MNKYVRLILWCLASSILLTLIGEVIMLDIPWWIHMISGGIIGWNVGK